MTATPVRPRPTESAVRTFALVWIDAREAAIVRWEDGGPVIDRRTSDVPAHHRSTGHVRHVPSIRHGGGGAPQTAEEPHRLEHLARFVDEVADRLAGDEVVVVIGPGTVHHHLAGRLRDLDDRQGRARSISAEASGRLTDRQLGARLRDLLGIPPKRRAVGTNGT